ncbi:hypothetical protein CGZ94_00105 [Enemella evansiae]|uniref:Endonuclease V n=1 Tax=Enemella evansiae TaxID=2016499 RepID=A0A255GNG5_9ACTN|nr:endonuclease V [Enemella evansiae]OYO17355.1 hypothetical protein CGZ94_00105 [Enemella evansiae]
MDYALTAGTVDVQYDDGQQRATAALVVCGELTFSSVVSEHVARISRIEPYEAGRLYKRELPCIQAVLALGPQLELLMVDGYATLDPQGRPGLGAHAADALGIPVIGVAKTPFHTATHATPVVRGSASRPVYVTAAGGLGIEEAARIVAAMEGPFRLPAALARVDKLARERVQPRTGA